MTRGFLVLAVCMANSCSLGYSQDIKSNVAKGWTTLQARFSGPIRLKTRQSNEGNEPAHFTTEIKQDGEQVTVILYSSQAEAEAWGLNSDYSFRLSALKTDPNGELKNWSIVTTSPLSHQNSMAYELCKSRILKPGREFLSVGVNEFIFLPDVLSGQSGDITFSNLEFDIMPNADNTKLVSMSFLASYKAIGRLSNESSQLEEFVEQAQYSVILDSEHDFIPIRCEFSNHPESPAIFNGSNLFSNQVLENETTFPAKIVTTLNLGGANVSTTELVVDSISFAAIPSSEFRLVSFGLPEPPFAKQSRWFSWWYAAALLGLIGVGFLTRWMRRPA